MTIPQQSRSRKLWGIGLLAGFLLAVVPVLGHGLEGPEPPAGKGLPAPRLDLWVRQGQLAVNLWEAEIGEVLARIGQEADLTILGGPHAGIRVSARFEDLELSLGLRRLLRLAALSHAIRYVEGPTGTAVMREVRLFGAAPEEPPPAPSLNQQAAQEGTDEARAHEAHTSGSIHRGPPNLQLGKAGAMQHPTRHRGRRAEAGR